MKINNKLRLLCKSTKLINILMVVFYFPHIILHELSHYVFILLSGKSKYYKFNFKLNGVRLDIGFESFENFEYGRWYLCCMLNCCIAPLFVSIIYYALLLKYNYLFNNLTIIYLIIGLLILKPSGIFYKSGGDIYAFKEFWRRSGFEKIN